MSRDETQAHRHETLTGQANGHSLRRRHTDTPRGWLRAHWAFGVALLFAGYSLWIATSKVDNSELAALKAQQTADRNEAALRDQRASRSFTVSALCGGLGGYGEAGRLVLLNDPREWAKALPPEEFAKLKPYTQAPEDLRVRLAYARAYSIVADSGIIREVGLDAEGLIRADGTLDCDELRERAAIGPAPNGKNP